MAPKTRNSKPTKQHTKKKPTQVVEANTSSDNDSDDEHGGHELSTNLEKLERQFREQRKSIASMTKSFDFMSDSFDQVKEQLTKIANEQKKMRKEIDRMSENEKAMKKRIDKLEMELAKDKQKSNENHVIITNMPKVDYDLKDAIVAIGKQVGCNIDPSGIIDVFQNENKKFKTHPIIVKLRTGDFKKKCAEFRKNGSKIDLKKLKVNDDIGDRNVNFHSMLEKEIADLLKQAKAVAKKKSYKFVWVSDSNVLVRKGDDTPVIKIKSTEDLKKIA